MKVKAAAKINLMLDILGTLPDGYHSLFMIMQSVDCCDTVEVNRAETGTGKIVIRTADERVPKDERNIAYKAAQAFFEETGVKNPGIEIAIEKKIPMAAGLAGGSADAAGVLYCLNSIFETDLPLLELARVGERVGADVPFSLIGGTALCMDKGGVIAPLRPLQNCTVLLCKPDMGVSTVSAYKMIDSAPRIRHTDKNAMLYAMHHGDYKLMCEKADNVFEQIVEVPKRPHIKGIMRGYGADLTLMSGSGPTVYGLFSDEDSAKACANMLRRDFREVFVCKPVEHGVTVVE